MTETTRIFDRLGSLDANVAILSKESERARDRDAQIFTALENLRVTQERAIAQHASLVMDQALVRTRLDEHQVTLDDYKAMKTRGTAAAFGISLLAGIVGYWFEHVKKWMAG